jgi:fatty-acyl-CoA synthase
LEYTLTNSRPRLFVFGEEFSATVSSLGLNSRRPLMLLAAIGAGSTAGDILDYRVESAACEGQQPFLTDLMAPAAPEEAQVIMYTSGTTGEPKGAVLSHRKTFFNCLNADIFFKLYFDDPS